MKHYQDIFSFIKAEESAYALPIDVIDGYSWNMKDHIQLCTLYKNSIFKTGKDDHKPFKNIIRPILNLQYRAEGFDVKDIQLFINDQKMFYKSFLIEKFHEKWARENRIDTFIDEMVESYVDYGGALIKNVNQKRPEVVPLQSIAFCDQSDLLSGSIGIRHFFSPDQLMEMEEHGWGNADFGADVNLEKLILLAENKKVLDKQKGQQVKTPGKYIEIYEVHGMFPARFIEGSSEKYIRQLHIVTFLHDLNGNKYGLTLFRGKEKELPFKLIVRDKIYGRALGFSGAEELFEPQVWVNYNVIRMKEMLDAASKVIMKTTDSGIASKHPSGLKDLDNLEIIEIEDGKDISQVNTTPINIALFERSVNEWEAHAQQMGAANDALMGKSPSSGTPFKLQELVTAEGHSLHEYRRGKLSIFIDEIYRDWIIPYISKEVSKEQEFVSLLDLDEMQVVANSLVEYKTHDFIKEKILNGELVDERVVANFGEELRSQFMNSGSKKFIKILEDEMKNAPIDVYVNVMGKQKDLVAVTDKLVNIFRQVVVNPAVLDDPRMAKLFNAILESSGISPIDFGSNVVNRSFNQIPQTGRVVLESPKKERSPIPAIN